MSKMEWKAPWNSHANLLITDLSPKSFSLFFFPRLLLGLYGYIPIFLMGNFRNGPYLVAFYFPDVGKKLAFCSPSLSASKSYGLTFLVSPPNCIPQYHPVMFYIITELVEQKYHLIGVCMLAWKVLKWNVLYRCQTWYKKALFNLVNAALGEKFVIDVWVLPYMLEISCLLVE